MKKERIIDCVDLEGGFATTLDLDVAMVNDYIGEIPVRPSAVAVFIGRIFGKDYQPFTIYYYGTPDEYLRKLFYYD